MSRRQLAVVAVLILLAGASFYGSMATAEQVTEYRYDVKTEQVEDARHVNGSAAVPVENLSDAEQDALYAAWKQSDHFLGGASVTIGTDEPLGLEDTDRWRLVDIEGVKLLVGIHGPQVHEYDRMTPASVGLIALTFLFGLAAVLGLASHNV